MSVREALPGEHLSPACGHHCGLRSSADEGKRTFIGHCFCPECRCPMEGATYGGPEPRPGDPGTGIPMCESWLPVS